MNSALLKGADELLELMGATSKEEGTLSSNTKVRLGVVVTLLLGLLAMLGTMAGTAWYAGSWMSSMTIKMDTVLDGQSKIEQKATGNASGLIDLKADLAQTKQDMRLMDSLGTQRMQDAVAKIQLQLSDLSGRLAEAERRLATAGKSP